MAWSKRSTLFWSTRQVHKGWRRNRVDWLLSGKTDEDLLRPCKFSDFSPRRVDVAIGVIAHDGWPYRWRCLRACPLTPIEPARFTVKVTENNGKIRKPTIFHGNMPKMQSLILVYAETTLGKNWPQKYPHSFGIAACPVSGPVSKYL
jgi:hypothetical protein